MLDLLQFITLFLIGYLGSNWIARLLAHSYYGWTRTLVVLWAAIIIAMII